MEKWKAIEGIEEYAVSDLGRVKRIVACAQSPAGRLIRNACLNAHGYLYVQLGKGRRVYLHRIVAKAFLPNPLNLPDVNHKKAKTNNRATNLEWRSKAGHVYDNVQRCFQGEGVYFDKQLGKWTAGYNPKPNDQRVLGHFATRSEAKAVRDKAVASLPFIL